MKYEQKISDCIQTFEEGKNKGLDYSSFCSLAKGYYILGLDSSNVSYFRKWNHILKNKANTLSSDIVRNSMNDDISRLQQILSVPGKYNADEILLILMLFTDLKCSQVFFNELEWSNPPFLDSTFEDDITTLRQDKETRNEYNNALRLIKRNGGSDLKFSWLR